MGNNNSTTYDEEGQLPIRQDTPISERRPEETILLVNRIHELSQRLWNEYTTDFLDPNFCQRVALAYKNRLKNLTVKQLKGINNKINNSESITYDLVLTHPTNDTETFLTDQLHSGLTDFFGNKNVNLSFKLGDVKAVIDGISYIDPKVKEHLSAALSSYGDQQGGNPEDDVGSIVSSPPDTSAPVPPDEDSIESIFAALKNIDVGNNSTNSTNTVTNNVKNSNNTNINTSTNQNNNNTKNKRANANTNSNTNTKNTRNTNIKNTNNANTKNKRNNTITNNVNNMDLSNLKIDEINAELANLNKIGNDVSNIKPANVPANTNVKQNTQMVSINTSCGAQNKSCRMTKSQLCQAITNHYMVRANIIAAILTTIPHKNDKTGDYEGSFCFDRMRALNQGTFCLPPDIQQLDSLPIAEKAIKLQEFIGKTPEQCKEANGIYKLLTPKERTILLTSNDEYNKIYMAYTEQLQERYRLYLSSLLQLLEILAGETEVNNKDLERIANDAKQLIDNMYKMCQFNYVMALLAYLKLDLTRDRRAIRRENDTKRSLYSGLE